DRRRRHHPRHRAGRAAGARPHEAARDHRRRRTGQLNRIVFACSGSPENLAAIQRLASAYDAEGVALTLHLGPPRELEGGRQAALGAGASRAHALDAREEFARACIIASLASDTATYPAGAALALPLVARKLVEIAHIEGATAIAHGGDQADHAGIDAAAQALQP